MDRETGGIFVKMLDLDKPSEIPKPVVDLYEKTLAFHRFVRPATQISCEGLAIIAAVAGCKTPQEKRLELKSIADNLASKRGKADGRVKSVAGS